MAVGVVDVWPHPVVMGGHSALHQDEDAGVTKQVPLPRDNVGGAVDEHVRGSVEVVFQTLSVSIEE